MMEEFNQTCSGHFPLHGVSDINQFRKSFFATSCAWKCDSWLFCWKMNNEMYFPDLLHGSMREYYESACRLVLSRKLMFIVQYLLLVSYLRTTDKQNQPVSRDNSVVKSTCCFPWGLKFNSQHQCQEIYNQLLTSPPRDPIPPDSAPTLSVHTYMQILIYI